MLLVCVLNYGKEFLLFFVLKGATLYLLCSELLMRQIGYSLVSNWCYSVWVSQVDCLILFIFVFIKSDLWMSVVTSPRFMCGTIQLYKFRIRFSTEKQNWRQMHFYSFLFIGHHFTFSTSIWIWWNALLSFPHRCTAVKPITLLYSSLPSCQKKQKHPTFTQHIHSPVHWPPKM